MLLVCGLFSCLIVFYGVGCVLMCLLGVCWQGAWFLVGSSFCLCGLCEVSIVGLFARIYR